jgi:hypothetical protein
MRTFISDKERAVTGRTLRLGACAAALIAATLAGGCSNPAGTGSTTPAAYTTYLYMTDTTNGRVYTFNPSTHVGSSTSLINTSSAAGEVEFYKGIGYVAVGYNSGAGVYYFDPSSSAPSAKLIGGSAGLDAEYFAFYSPTLAYVSVVGTGDTGGIYTFNPSSPSSGFTQVAATGANKYLQEIIIGPDQMIYVAENYDKAVLRINPTNYSNVTTVATSEQGPTGLVSGTYNGLPGVFVANTGTNYLSGAATPGSIDFIAAGSSTATTVTANSIYPARLIQLPNGSLIATGYDNSYTPHTYLVTLSGTNASVSEIRAGTTSFGSFSIAYNSSSGLIYVPNNIYGTSNQLYVFDASGNQQSYSPVSVMTSSDNIANVAFYQD